MENWNVVVTMREHGYRQALDLLQAFGAVAGTAYDKVLTLRVADPTSSAGPARRRGRRRRPTGRRVPVLPRGPRPRGAARRRRHFIVRAITRYLIASKMTSP